MGKSTSGRPNYGWKKYCTADKGISRVLLFLFFFGWEVVGFAAWFKILVFVKYPSHTQEPKLD